MTQALLASYANPLLVVDSADFDGTNDYMNRGAGLTGAADSKSGILSVWLRIDGHPATSTFPISGSTALAGAVVPFRLTHASSGIFDVLASNTSGTPKMELFTTGTFTTGATWHHVLASWDVATTAGSLYIDDASDLNVGSNVDETLDYTYADWAVGARPDGNSGTIFDGCIAELYFAPGQYLDCSLAANRRKFISESGKPVHLGADGSLPTGTAPLVYQHLDDAEAVANFATNAGTGGDFSITGTLTTGSTSPSD